MAKAKKNNTKKMGRKYVLIIAGLIALTAVFFIRNKKSTKTPVSVFKIGAADKCRHNPAFIPKVGLKEPVMIDFRQKEVSGFQLIEAKKDGKVVRMPSWDDAGHLGPYTVDEHGNIFTAPVPYVSIFENPPAEQNKIYKVNTNDGKMKEFMALTDETPNNDNPFGVMGIAYDCDVHALYATSIAGSTMKAQKGIIYKINPKTREIMAKLEGFDAIGIGIYNTVNGKKLFLGAARTPEIFSVTLDEKGNFVGRPTFEFSLAALEGGSYDNAHRIRFLKDDEMEIKAIEFSYSLIASSDPLRNIYKFTYDKESDTWNNISIEKQQN